jgi:hypothetical protein
MSLTDEDRVLKLIARARLLIAIDDEMPSEVKLNTQPLLKMLEAAIAGETPDAELASRYYGQLCGELSPYPDIEALLSAMRVFLTYL